MLRIGISTSSFLNRDGTLKNYDGLGQFTRLVAEHVGQLKSQAKVVPTHFSMLSHFTNKLSQAKPFKREAAHFLLSYLSPFSLYKDLEQKIDVFHATDFRVPKIGVPVVTTVHDATCLKYGGTSLKRLVANPLFRKGIARSDRVIADCYAILPDLTKYWGIDQDKVDVVHPGRDPFFDHECSYSEIKQCHAHFNLPRPYLLFVSTLRTYKNVDRLLDAFFASNTLSQQVDLVLVGRMGKEKIHQKLHARVNALASGGKIKWLSYVDKKSLRALYQGALGVAFPSLYEGFGFPILEAFASKVPLLTSNIGAMAEIAGDSALLVDPYSVDAMCHGLEKLAYNKGLRQDLIVKGKKRVGNFSWEKAAKQMVDVYKKVT